MLAPAILSFIAPGRFERLIEPFAGSAAITLAAASKKLVNSCVIADLLKPLTEIWNAILQKPDGLADAYEEIWQQQAIGDSTDWFNRVRAEFNKQHDPAKLLFLLARCVKNAVRFSNSGDFNQSPDKRRRGMHPVTMRAEILAAHKLLRNRSEVICGDFRRVLTSATSVDLVYMDPPYQGTSEGRDRRYIKGVQRSEMIAVLADLNKRSIEYILSYDGRCGGKEYGEPLPAHLNLHRVLLEVGRSSQATLNGRDDVTVESIYLSPGLRPQSKMPFHVHLRSFSPQNSLFPISQQ